jgi:hypothetical protein
VTARAEDARALATPVAAALAVAVACAIGVVGYENGFFAPAPRLGLATAAWALVAALASARGFVVDRVGRALVAAFALFALWTLASAGWGSDAGAAVGDGARVVGYVGILLVVAIASSRRSLRPWSAGIALGAGALVAIALASRLFPHLFSDRGVVASLPAVGGRLTFPLGYWNAVGAVAGMSVPLALGWAGAARTAALRAAAVGGVPLAAATLYLTSSRGGFVAAAVGSAVVVAVDRDRWASFARAVVAAAGSVIAIAFVASSHALVNGPLGSAAATSQGRSAFVVLVVVAAGTALLAGLGARALVSVSRPSPGFAGVLVALAVAAAAVGLVLAHPVARVHAFTALPGAGAGVNGDFARTHLFSGAGNGRWQFWSAAVDEFRAHPLAGGGSGSFGAWWLQHGSFRYHVDDAHSLYLETLGELGLVGLLVLVACIAAAVAVCGRALRDAAPSARSLAAGAVGAVVAYAAGAGLDWLWEIPGVTITAVACLGLLTGPAFAATRRVPGRRAAGVITASALAAGAALLLVAQLALDASRREARDGHLPAAFAVARTAARLEPWAAEPRVQLALVSEQYGDTHAARAWIGAAARRADDDWTIHVLASRIALEAGNVLAARRELARARELNPRSTDLGRRP